MVSEQPRPQPGSLNSSASSGAHSGATRLSATRHTPHASTVTRWLEPRAWTAWVASGPAQLCRRQDGAAGNSRARNSQLWHLSYQLRLIPLHRLEKGVPGACAEPWTRGGEGEWAVTWAGGGMSGTVAGAARARRRLAQGSARSAGTPSRSSSSTPVATGTLWNVLAGGVGHSDLRECTHRGQHM